ncbi:unnamed protein product, partial [Thlaspi arvense]
WIRPPQNQRPSYHRLFQAKQLSFGIFSRSALASSASMPKFSRKLQGKSMTPLIPLQSWLQFPWEKPLHHLAESPLLNSENSQWPALPRGIQGNSRSTEAASLKAHSKEYPWAARMNQSLRNLHRVTIPELLVIFCIINLLNYMDRGAIASNGVNGSTRSYDDKGKCNPATGIQGNFNLSNFEDGVLSSSFMVRLLIASPIFASLAKSFNPFRLIGVGLTVWTVAVLGCGSSFAFWFIVLCRMFVGVGEASFISLAAPFIDDNAPHKQKAVWLGVFYMCIPSGVALGYVYGGYVGKHFSWRYAFWGEAVLMAPFAVLGFLMKPLQLKGFPATDATDSIKMASSTQRHLKTRIIFKLVVMRLRSPLKLQLVAVSKSFTQFAKDMKVLCKEKVFVVNVLGYVSYNFVIGAYSYWGPKAGYNIYKMIQTFVLSCHKNANMIFGAVTIICGIIGTLSGGFILDRVTATIPNAFKLLSGATFLGAIFCFTAFTLKSLNGFIALFALGELLVFATQAPVNYVCLHCGEPSLRPLSMAISTVAIHIFGDVPSSPLVGIVQTAKTITGTVTNEIETQ